MGKFTRREWIKPAMLVFGAQAGAAKGSNKQGSKCGESVIQYGGSCRIQKGNKCKTQTGNKCKTHTGNKCKTHTGNRCK